jgi:hypothetical protein
MASLSLKSYIFSAKNTWLITWCITGIFCAFQAVISYRFNNYFIYENTFRNLINQSSFYASYPTHHFDVNHYGPIFGVFFMPFALLPNVIGLFLWDLFNIIILFKAIERIPIKNKNLIYLISIPCLVSSSLSEQLNPTVGAFIILSYTLLNKDKGIWATLLIVLGTFIKLYGIVGLAFFFFVKDKKRFIVYLFMWAVVLFILPMLFSSPSFIINSYKEWAISLIEKNEGNMLSPTIDISIMGFVRAIFVGKEIPNIIFLIIGVVIFAIPYLNFKAFANQKFQIHILASALMFPVLFSSSSEDCTYIIAITGVGLWYLFTEKRIWKTCLLGLTIIFSFNFPLLLFSGIANENPILLSIMSLPFFIVWLFIIIDAYQLKIERPYA